MVAAPPSAEDVERWKKQMAKMPLDAEASDGEVETVTVSWGSEKFSPIQYHTLEIGGFFVTTRLKPGEAIEDAMARAYKAADKVARVVFLQRKEEYLARVRELGEEVERRRST